MERTRSRAPLTKLAALPLALAATLGSACWPAALHPLYLPEDRTPPIELFGTWRAVDDGDERLTLEARPGKRDGTFHVAFSEGRKVDGRQEPKALVFEGRATVLGGAQFWDLVPVKPEDDSEPVLPYLLRPHYFLRVDTGPEGLELRWLDAEWLAARADAGVSAAAFVELDDHLVMTAGTEALREWLVSEADDPEAFAGEGLRYTRLVEQAAPEPAAARP
jgi:hypothetical protein